MNFLPLYLNITHSRHPETAEAAAAVDPKLI